MKATEKGTAAYLRFLQGDEQGLTERVSLYNAALVRYINGIIRDPFEAEDIAADSFLHLLIKKPKLRREEAIKTYLFKVAHHKAVDHLRKKTRQGVALPDEDEEQYIESDAFLWQGLLVEERQKQLHTALRKLHPDYAELLHLLYFEEVTPEMAGKILGKSKRQLANLSYRAKQALKMLLEREGFVYQND